MKTMPLAETDLVRQIATFIEALDAGAHWLRSAETIKNYRSTLRLFARRTRLVSASQITPLTLRRFLQPDGPNDHRSASTLASYRKNMARFLDWCVEQQLLLANPLAQLPAPPVLPTLPEHYSTPELARVLKCVQAIARTQFERARNVAIFAVLVMAGLRRGELLGLRLSSVDLTENIIRIDARSSKSRRPRIVAITTKLRTILLIYLRERGKRHAESDHFWLSGTRNMQFTLHGLRHLTARLSTSLGFRVRIHKMRHTFATRYYQGSRDLAGLQSVLGHRSITTTMIYTHVLPGMTAAAMETNPVNQLF